MKRLCLAVLALSLAAGAEEKKKRDFAKLTVTEGTVVCIGCELEKDGAEAQCTLHAKHALGLKDADGRLWSFVDNKRGHVLRGNEKLKGREVRVRAWRHERALHLEPWSYEVKDGEKWQLYTYCDNCGFEKGDNGEDDLCGDCEE